MTKVDDDAAIAFLSRVLDQVKHWDLIKQSDGQRRLGHMFLATTIVAGKVKPDFQTWADDFDKSRALDAVAAFRPEHPVAVEWCRLKSKSLTPAMRGEGRGAMHGRDLVAVNMVEFLIENCGYKAQRGRNSTHEHSASDIVAKVLNNHGKAWATYFTVKNAWEKRKK